MYLSLPLGGVDEEHVVRQSVISVAEDGTQLVEKSFTGLKE